ncbi:rhodanese-like domain-containing protein [Maribacter sp. 2307ULW6-5]|uniref:rhodanese-like domain-containing protein n=1 Tax=Maribacter sp. 2307ULW6-5 TaxID=3386275 RepID=UPI0039BD2E8C
MTVKVDIWLVLGLLFLPVVLGFGQRGMDRSLALLNSESVPYIQTSEMDALENVLLLDTRSPEEYGVSHLKDSHHVGYEDFDAQRVLEQFPDREQPIVVYCSIGVRSEDIGEKLLEMGYKNVYNLYGGLFKWKNEDRSVYSKGKETDSVHAYNRLWGKLLEKGVKVFK